MELLQLVADQPKFPHRSKSANALSSIQHRYPNLSKMMMSKAWASVVMPLLGFSQVAHSLTFAIPSTPPSNASGTLSSAPVGLSFEFFAFPAYIDSVAATNVCISNLEAAMGASPPIRIGGTTQDRATYDPSLTSAVSYTTSTAGAAPTALTFGPSFMSIAAGLGGSVTLGLNRRLDQLSNTISAAEEAVAEMSNLYALELGNEPNFYTSSDPIAGSSSWTPAVDAASQVSWQQSVGSALGKTSFVQAGVFFSSSTWNVAELEPTEGSSATYVKTYADHYYPQSASTANLSLLMNHPSIMSGVAGFKTDIAAAAAASKPFVMGETNSATQGGGGISPTFGAALWILDYVMQAVLVGVKQLYFHQGTIGNCQYCWWGNYDMGAPYYGAYTAALALSGASQIAQLDTGSTNYAVYVIYSGTSPVRALLYNSDYYTSGTRSSVSFTLTGIPSSAGSSVTARRLAGTSATARVDQGGSVTIGGQYFANGTCVKSGTQSLETTTVTSGAATFTVAASEALLINL